ncbi:hypothetical protein IWW34DRAFT_719560 [Fusarium oxysporum f. sp. albedinis]|nr:hypothetical protein BKA60DRAFT_558852 [Fusarium oxysporum]KAI3586678.1 hypothetical protein IWW34DRAFT_719560 [Fusarium oxysporum f. sp. albedinis]
MSHWSLSWLAICSTSRGQAVCQLSGLSIEKCLARQKIGFANGMFPRSHRAWPALRISCKSIDSPAGPPMRSRYQPWRAVSGSLAARQWACG